MTEKLGKILLVDDDEMFLSLVENYVKDTYEIITADSLKKALEYVNIENKPDLILLDISTFDMNGWEMFNVFRSINFLDNTPIAFFTSNDNSDDIKHAMDIGAADYIIKPCDKTTLLKRIQNIIGNF